MPKLFIILLATSLLCSCGVKGDLYLPGQKPPHHRQTSEDTSAGPDKINTNVENTDNINK